MENFDIRIGTKTQATSAALTAPFKRATETAFVESSKKSNLQTLVSRHQHKESLNLVWLRKGMKVKIRYRYHRYYGEKGLVERIDSREAKVRLLRNDKAVYFDLERAEARLKRVLKRPKHTKSEQ